MTKNSSFQKKGLQVRSSSRAGWGQFAQRFNSCNWPAGWAAPPQPACPQLGHKRRACANGKLDAAHAQEKARRMWRRRSTHLTRHGAYELT